MRRTYVDILGDYYDNQTDAWDKISDAQLQKIFQPIQSKKVKNSLE